MEWSSNFRDWVSKPCLDENAIGRVNIGKKIKSPKELSLSYKISPRNTKINTRNLEVNFGWSIDDLKSFKILNSFKSYY